MADFWPILGHISDSSVFSRSRSRWILTLNVPATLTSKVLFCHNQGHMCYCNLGCRSQNHSKFLTDIADNSLVTLKFIIPFIKISCLFNLCIAVGMCFNYPPPCVLFFAHIISDILHLVWKCWHCSGSGHQVRPSNTIFSSSKAQDDRCIVVVTLGQDIFAGSPL